MGAFQGPPVLHCFGHMRDLHGAGACQVGDGARHFHAAMNAPARPAQARGSSVEKLRCGRIELALRIDRLAFERLVGASLPGQGAFPGQGDATANGLGRLARRGVHQFVGG